MSVGSRNIGPVRVKTVVVLVLWTAIIGVSFFSVSAEEEKTSQVIGVVGSSADLPCDVDVSNCGKVYFITWTKNVSGEWKRLYLFSDAVEKPLQELNNPGRAKFHLGESTAYLRIDPLRIEDDGTYKCDVTYVQGKCPSLSFAMLTTYAPPSVPIIEKDGKASLNGSVVGPFYEGAALNLECESFGGKPTPQMFWYKGSQELDSESKVHGEKNGAFQVTSALKVSLGREDLGAKIECRVDNEAIDEPLVTWVEVDLHVGPLSLEVSGPDTPVTSGDTVTLTCTIFGAKPAANATWFNRSDVLDAVPTTRVDLSEDGTFTTVSRVNVVVSRHDHQGTYYCKGANSVLHSKGEAPLLKSLDLQVLHPPAVVMQPPGGVIVNESATAVIYCTYEANPSDVSDVVWYHEGKKLAVPTQGKYEYSNQGYPTLTIRDVRKEDRGMYTCSLSNAIGRGNATNEAEVNVLFPPRVEATISPEGVKEGESVSLFCDLVEGNPQNLLSVRWFKGDEMLHETTEREIVWVGVTRNTSGVYRCEGENKAGWGEKSDIEELVVHYLPGPAELRELDSPALKGETSSLQCIVEDLGLPAASVYRWEHDGELLATTSSENHTTEVHRVSSKGNYSCSAVNEVGNGPKGFKQIPVYAPPTFIRDLPDIRGAARDAPFISFECRVECEPLCEVLWTKDGERVANSDMYVVRNRVLPEEASNNRFRSVESKLLFNMTAWPGRRLQRDRDRANYTCQSTPNMVGDGVSSSMLFLVEYAPESMSLSEGVVRVEEGSTPPDIECSASSWPASTFLWLRGDMVLARDDTLAFNGSISRDADGEYVCVAENRHGKAQIELKLEVMYKPECNIAESTNDAGASVLVCRADGFPTKINFTWSKGNETLDDEFDMELDDHSVYVLPADSSQRYGLYKCVAINDVGESEKCELMVSGPGLAGWHAEFGDKNVLVIAAIIGSIAILFVLAIIIIILIMRKRRLRNFSSSPGKAPLGSSVAGDSLYQNVSGGPAKQNGPSAPDSEGNTMYENMPFHRTGPYRPDSSDEMVYADLYDDVKSGKVPDPRMKPPLPPKGIGKKPKEPPLPPKTKKGGIFDALGI